MFLLHRLPEVGVDVWKTLWVWTMLVQHIKVQPLQTETLSNGSRPGSFNMRLMVRCKTSCARVPFSTSRSSDRRGVRSTERSQLGRQLLIVNLLWGAS